MAGKKYLEAKKKVEPREYSLEDAIQLLQRIKFTRFDETLEIALRLGVDPRHADQMVRGTVVLPHGLGKAATVCVIASGERVKEAEAAGADIVGGDEIVERIQKGWLGFDAVVATPDMMKLVGRLGRILGPRGMMPNPKAGTVTFDVGHAVREIKAGKVEFRVDRQGVIHAPLGQISFSADHLVTNARSLITAVVRARPAAAKGRYLRTIYLSSTMSPGVKVDANRVEAA